MYKKRGLSKIVITVLFIITSLFFAGVLFKITKENESLLTKKSKELHEVLENKGKVLLIYNPKVDIVSADKSRSYSLYLNKLKEWLRENGIQYQEVAISSFSNIDSAVFSLLENSRNAIFYSWACSSTDKEILRKYVEGGGNLVAFSSCFLDGTGTSIDIDQDWYQQVFGFKYSYVGLNSNRLIFYVKPSVVKITTIASVILPSSFVNTEVMIQPVVGDPILYTTYKNKKYAYIVEDNKGSSKTLYIDDKFLELYLEKDNQNLRDLYDKVNLLLLYSISNTLS